MPQSLALRATTSLLLALCVTAPASSTSPSKGDAEGKGIQAGALSANVTIHGEKFDGLAFKDALSKRTLPLGEAFVLVLKDHSELRSTQMQVAPILDAATIVDPHRALSRSHDSTESLKRCWNFTAPQHNAQAQWCLIARPGTQYLRELLQISAQNSDLPIAEVRMLQFDDATAKVDGTVKGSPVIDGNMYFGVEHPLSTSSVSNGVVTTSYFRELPLRAGQSITYSAVIGTAPAGEMRRAFLTYIETERPRPYEPFLHYNSWYDLGFGNRFDEAGAIDRINAFGQQLTEQRHVKLDSFLFDDGWDDTHTLWGFNPGFPDGFTKATAAAEKYNAGVGVWLSPWGGYDKEKTERIAFGTAHGYEILKNGYALSGPKYFAQFEKTCLEMVDKYHVNQFKFDGTGNVDRVYPGSAFDSDFDAAIHLIERLRKEKSDLFINLTTGTTASPFWLFYADSIWRSGEDHSFSGEGTWRQRWITYRDAQTYKNIVLKGPLFPLNSLMLHGIVYAKQAENLGIDPANDFADEVHSYFGTGTQLQEMYITPSLLSKENWDTLAASARWSRAHAATLKDVHWVGGDPDKLQAYGWAAWGSQQGILTLRNPSSKPQHFDIELTSAFELTKNAPHSYAVQGVWNGVKGWAPGDIHKVQSGTPVGFDLAPFEVLTLEATPQK
jgi:hypothetical protein